MCVVVVTWGILVPDELVDLAYFRVQLTAVSVFPFFPPPPDRQILRRLSRMCLIVRWAMNPRVTSWARLIDVQVGVVQGPV